MNLSLILFLIGILGFVLNRKNIILMLISIEIMLLAITFLILVSSASFDDILGQTYAIYIISIAGAESAIGLGILVAFYRLNSSLISTCVHNNNITNTKNVNKRKKIFFFVSLKGKTKSYSTMAKINYIPSQCISSSISPLFVTGLFDAESSFVVTILKTCKHKTGWRVQARVQIKMHEKDRKWIQSIKDFFRGIGSIPMPNKNFTVEFRVSALKDLVNVILPHFYNYPLITKKHSDYLLFKQIVLLMLNKEHTSIEGLRKIINIKIYLNTGLSDSLKNVFPHTIPINKLKGCSKNNTLHENLRPEWVPGFSTGESNFFIAVQRSKTKSGISASLRFSIAQHSRDVSLLKIVRYKSLSLKNLIL